MLNIQLDALLRRLEARLPPTQSDSPSSELDLKPPSGWITMPVRPRLDVPPIASGRGWSDEQEQEYAHRFQTQESRLRSAGVPPRYLAYTWQTWPGKTRQDLLAWPTKPGEDGAPPWAVFAYGPKGTGKTHVTTAILADLLCRGWSCRWFEVAEAIEEAKAEFDDQVYEGRAMKALKETPVILLDDLGAERLTDFAADLVAQVLRYRYNRQRWTIVNTNLELEELDAIDSRLGSRLAGREALQINFAGRKDWRL